MFDSKPGTTNKKELVKILNDLDFDFLTVEEIVNAGSFTNLIERNFRDHKLLLSRCGGGGKQKLGFIYNKSKFQLINFYEDDSLSDTRTSDDGCGRLRPALVGIFKEKKTNKKFVMIGVHLKAGGSPSSYAQREEQYKTLKSIIRSFKRKRIYDVVVMGDFNTTGYVHRDEDYSNFRDLLSDVRLNTSATKLDCTSYWSGMNTQDDIEESSILDHIVYPDRFLNYSRARVEVHSHCAKVRCSNVSDRELGKSYEEVSDHCPVITTFY